MKPRLDLIQSRFIRTEEEAFGLDIAKYINLDIGAKHLISGAAAQQIAIFIQISRS